MTQRSDIEAPPTIYVYLWIDGKRKARALYKLTADQLTFLEAAIVGERARRAMLRKLGKETVVGA